MKKFLLLVAAIGLTAGFFALQQSPAQSASLTQPCGAHQFNFTQVNDRLPGSSEESKYFTEFEITGDKNSCEFQSLGASQYGPFSVCTFSSLRWEYSCLDSFNGTKSQDGKIHARSKIGGIGTLFFSFIDRSGSKFYEPIILSTALEIDAEPTFYQNKLGRYSKLVFNNTLLSSNGDDKRISTYLKNVNGKVIRHWLTRVECKQAFWGEGWQGFQYFDCGSVIGPIEASAKSIPQGPYFVTSKVSGGTTSITSSQNLEYDDTMPIILGATTSFREIVSVKKIVMNPFTLSKLPDQKKSAALGFTSTAYILHVSTNQSFKLVVNASQKLGRAKCSATFGVGSTSFYLNSLGTGSFQLKSLSLASELVAGRKNLQISVSCSNANYEGYSSQAFLLQR